MGSKLTKSEFLFHFYTFSHIREQTTSRKISLSRRKNVKFLSELIHRMEKGTKIGTKSNFVDNRTEK